MFLSRIFCYSGFSALLAMSVDHFTEVPRKGSVIAGEGQDLPLMAGAGALGRTRWFSCTGGFNSGEEI